MPSEATRLRPATVADIQLLWSERWGLPVITPWGRYQPGDVQGLAAGQAGDGPAGLITWARRGQEADLVTLDALQQGRGLGSRLLAAAEEQLAAAGVRRLRLVTTNDDLRAFGLYLRRGYRLTALHLDRMAGVRRDKPAVPRVGEQGIALLDMWELTKALSGPGCEGRDHG